MTKQRVIHIIWVLSLLPLLVLLLGNVEKAYNTKEIKDIQVIIDNQVGNYFVSDAEIIRMLTGGGRRMIVGAPYESIDLKTLESELEDHPFVQDAEVYRDLRGNLIARIEQCRPVARLSSDRLPDRYITDRGKVLPVSGNYTARVLILRGNAAGGTETDDLTSTETGQNILELLHYIDSDPFWKAQIAGMEVDRKGRVILYPQVGRQRIEFGRPEQFVEKFGKLQIFYKEILPKAGWNAYARVNVEFNDQIVCE